MEATISARTGGAEVMYAQAESAWMLYLQVSEASRKVKGQDAQLRAAEEAAAVMAGRAWGVYMATKEELMRIRLKKSLKMSLTKSERATWTLYGQNE